MKRQRPELGIPETVDTQVVIQSQHNHRAWHAALPNGKIVMAFVNEEDTPPELHPGQSVPVRLTVTDFSRALIVLP